MSKLKRETEACRRERKSNAGIYFEKATKRPKFYQKKAQGKERI